MIKNNEKGILLSKGTITVREDDSDTTECGAGKGAIKGKMILLNIE